MKGARGDPDGRGDAGDRGGFGATVEDESRCRIGHGLTRSPLLFFAQTSHGVSRLPSLVVRAGVPRGQSARPHLRCPCLA